MQKNPKVMKKKRGTSQMQYKNSEELVKLLGDTFLAKVVRGLFPSLPVDVIEGGTTAIETYVLTELKRYQKDSVAYSWERYPERMGR
jgi:siroheme synthase